MRFFRFNNFNNEFEALNNLQHMMNEYLGESSPFYSRMGLNSNRHFPPVNIFENGDDNLVIKSEIPGMKKEDINISIKEKMLTISGKRDLEKDKNKYSYHRKERPDGEFSRNL